MLPFTVRILSLDVGDRRIGVALSDPSRKIAQGLKVYTRRSRPQDVEEMRDLVRECHASLIVVGLPKNLDGSVGPRAKEIMQFAEEIKAVAGVAIDFWDERFSTDEANRIFDMASVNRKKRKGSIDVMAAQIILQGYLDAQSYQ